MSESGDECKEMAEIQWEDGCRERCSVYAGTNLGQNGKLKVKEVAAQHDLTIKQNQPVYKSRTD